MGFLHNTWRLFAANARTAILFELAFRTLFALLFVPMCFGMVNLALSAAGLTYVADTNLSAFLSNPLTWAFLLVAVLLLAFCTLFEMCTLVVIMQAGKIGRRIGVLEASRCAFVVARRIAYPTNWLLVLFVLLLVPLTNLAITSSALTGLRLPEFIMDFIWENPVLAALFIVVMAGLYLHAFYLAFGIHFFTLGGEPWLQARVLSKHFVRGNAWRLLRRLLALFAVFALSAVVATIIGLVAMVSLLAGSFSIGVSIVLGLVMLVFVIVVGCVFTPFGYAALSCTFYEIAAERDVPILYSFATRTPTARARLASFAGIACVVVLAGASLFAYNQARGVFEPALDSPSHFAVTAHRGGALEAPENTLAAFQNAIDQGADWVELDVQQTSDGVLMVMHDANLKRTTGLDKEFWQVTYSEIEDLDNGSWFDPAFAGERVCTLEEALVLCKGKIKMNIEVKPDGHGADLERKTVELINRYDMKDQVAVASITYESLVRVKEIDPTMPTMFDMTLAYGRITDLEHVDYFSVDDFFVTQRLVDEVRGAGKIIYAWTVNDPANMSRLICYGIDCLVTDNVAEAQELYKSEQVDASYEDILDAA